jgi:ubiquinone/menaquinone biosynthesis C-methylase UbiE
MFPHRASPLARTTIVENRQARLRFRYRTGDPDEYIFTADLYAYRERAHPERHLGWWRFNLPRGRGEAELRFDFREVTRESVVLQAAGAHMALVDAWVNPSFAFDPLIDVELVFRDRSGLIRRMEPALLKIVDRDVLREFYARHYATQGYAPGQDAPFLHELHAYKLRKLRALFERHIPPGGTALDVGCGRSLFADIGVPFPFAVVAGDLDFASVRDRAREVLHQRWAVFDASQLPFADGEFDALFAGEVIEHVPDATATLREWWRVLKPGGMAIITTPNRRRLMARANRMEMPYSPDHLSELSYEELSGSLLRDTGFERMEQACLYLELYLKGLTLGRGRAYDYLQREGNQARNVWLMRRLLPLGSFFPSASLAMIVVARKLV